MFCSLQQAVHYLALLASHNCLFSCLLRPKDVLDKERTGGTSSLPSLLCWVDIEHSFSHKTSTVLQHHRSIQNHRLHRNPLRRFQFIPQRGGQGGQRSPVRALRAARPGLARHPPPGGARRGRSTHTSRGASGQRPRLGMDMLGQGQRRGTARTPGALTGCHRPPHLASLSASGVPNARTDRRSHGRGSRSPPLWGQALSLGDSNAQMPAGFALLSPHPDLPAPALAAGAPPPPERWQTRTAPAGPHLSRRGPSAAGRLPCSPAGPAPAPAAAAARDAGPPPSIAGRERGQRRCPGSGAGWPQRLPLRPPRGAARPRALPSRAAPGQLRAGCGGTRVGVARVPWVCHRCFQYCCRAVYKQQREGYPSTTTAACCSARCLRHLIISFFILVFW